jgi:hypothetical protein
MEAERKRKEREAKLAARTDDEIVSDIKDRFDIYFDMIQGTYEDTTSALIVSGSAGVGKSYTAEWALEHAEKTKSIKYRIVRGMITPIDLYELAYNMSNPGNVIVLDDADMIFDDEIGLNILKSLLDTSVERRVNWMTDHPRFKGTDALPKEFIFRGSMIFLTNKDFQKYIDESKGKYVAHMEALMSRSIYLDLKMHSRREVACWARHLVLRNKILRQLPTPDGKPITESEETMLMDWIRDNTDNLRELSIRTALKLGRIFIRNPNEWKRRAEILFLREDF